MVCGKLLLQSARAQRALIAQMSLICGLYPQTLCPLAWELHIRSGSSPCPSLSDVGKLRLGLSWLFLLACVCLVTAGLSAEPLIDATSACFCSGMVNARFWGGHGSCLRCCHPLFLGCPPSWGSPALAVP